MPPRRRRHVEVEDEDEEVIIHPRHRARRVKDPVRVARGKALWAAKTQEEKEVVLRRLSAGREARREPYHRAIKVQRKEFGRNLRVDTHRALINRRYTKKEARALIADLQRDLGTTIRAKRGYTASTDPPLPHLQNPLPQFFGKFIKQAAKFASVPLKAQIHIIKNTIPIATALGIVPPGSTAFTLLRLFFQNV